jgi:hypothetical protein
MHAFLQSQALSPVVDGTLLRPVQANAAALTLDEQTAMRTWDAMASLLYCNSKGTLVSLGPKGTAEEEIRLYLVY